MKTRVRSCCIGLVGALVAAGCIRADVQEVERAAPGDDASSAATESTDVGEPVTTASGNIVTVHRVDEGEDVDGSDLVLRSAEVEICARDDGEGAPADPAFFRAVIDDAGYRRPGPPGRTPALAEGAVDPGDCVRGWVSFPIRPDEDVVGIVLLASTIVEWSLP